MPEEKEPPRPHGDKLAGAIGNATTDRADNEAQVQRDAPPDALGAGGREASDRDRGQDSTANGVPVSDEDDGELRKRQYRNGAELVSGID